MGATIFNGAFIKALKANFKFLENVFIITDQAADPTSVAYSAPIGSLYFRNGTNEIYKKQDNGSSTNWSKLGSLTEMLAYYGSITSDPTGFPNRTDSTFSIVDGTRTFSIAPSAVSFDIFQNGVKYTFSTSQDVVFPDVEGVHHFYFDNGVLVTTQVFTPEIITDYVYIANIYWDAASNLTIFKGDERHGLKMDGATHSYLHNVLGAQYISGLALGDFLADQSGNLDTHAQFSYASGVITDEDIRLAISSVAVGVSNVPFFYLQGASANWRKSAPNAFPLRTTGTGRAAYNQFTGGAWQQTEVTNNNYVLSHIFATNDVTHSGYLIIQGQAQYSTLALARAGATTEINNLITGALPFQEFVPVATVIFQTSNTYANAVKSRVRTTDTGGNYVDWRQQQLGIGTPAVDHGSLAGLQDDDHTTLYKRIHAMTNATGTVSVLNTVQRGTFYLADSSGGNVTFNLDALTNFPDGYEITIKKIHASNYVLIDANGSELIDGAGILILLNINDQVTLVKRSTQWEAKGRTKQEPDGLIVGDDSIPRNSVGSWLTYADGSASPVDMTGGSPTNTLTRNTTNPISDVADFLYAKGAGSKIGEGFSLTFASVPNKYKSRGCIFRFKYLTDANYVDSEVGVFLYDITGAVVYQLTPLYLKKSSLIESSFAEIQLPATLTSGFRIGFHVIGTNATAYNIQFSEFTFDEKIFSIHADRTDTYDATPAALPTNATRQWAKYRRDGEGLWFDVCFTYTGNGSLSISYNTILPSGLNIDTNKLLFDSGSSISAGLGTVHFFNSGIANRVYLYEAQSTYLYMRGIEAGGETLTNGDNLNIKGWLPIQGWSAGTQVADIYTGRKIAFSAPTGSGNHTSNGSSQTVTTWGTTTIDDVGGWDSVTGTYTFKASGTYRIDVLGAFGASATGYRYWNIRVNNTTNYSIGYTSGSTNLITSGSLILNFNAGDTLVLQAFQNSGGNLAYSTEGRLSISKIDGPNQVLAGETVYEAYESSAGTSYANAANLVYGTKVKATHGSYNPSTGEFIANKTGDLEIDGLFGSLSTNTATEIYIYARKNGADFRVLSDFQRIASNRGVVKFQGKFPVVKNDSIFIRVAHDGTSMATAAFTFYNYINFTLK